MDKGETEKKYFVKITKREECYKLSHQCIIFLITSPHAGIKYKRNIYYASLSHSKYARGLTGFYSRSYV